LDKDKKTKPRQRIDKSYIAPQLTVREKIIAGMFVLLDVGVLFVGLGVPILVSNLFSPTLPWKWKLGNILALLVITVFIGAIPLSIWLLLR
jgi:hypothetical protein